MARRSWRSYWWTELERWIKPRNTCWHLCTWAAPAEAQVNLPGILRQHHNEQTRKSLWTCSPRELTHQDLTKNTLSPKAFR